MNVLHRSLIAFAIGLTGASALQSLDYAQAFDNTSHLAVAPVALNLGDCLREGPRKAWPAPYRAICDDLVPRERTATQTTAEYDCAVDESGTTRIVRVGKEQTLPPRYAVNSSGVALLVMPTCRVKSPVDGRILFAGDFKGYRGIVIIGLGAGRRLIVAGLGTLGTKRGERVQRGMTLGTTSAIGAPALTSAFHENAASRSMLYFDLRNAKGVSERILWLAASG